MLLAALGVLTCGGAVAIARARSEPPQRQLEAARRALEEARTEGAGTYAAGELEIAESRLEAARRSYRMAEERWLGYRDYPRIAGRLEAARQSAVRAATVARQRRAEARRRAEEDIAGAQARLDDVSRRIVNVPIGEELRAAMVSSEISLAQARSRFERSEYAAASRSSSVALLGLGELDRRIGGFLAEYTAGASSRLWDRWVRETLDESRRSGGPAVIVDKLRRACRLYRGGRLVRTYPADLGSRPLVQKMQAGDRATPEGRYRITEKRDRGQTRYYRALMLDYPNAEDRRRFREARRAGRIPPGASPGGLIEIHGDGGRNENWTLGCVALSNPDMDHLFSRVERGSPVTIVGSME